MTRERLKQMNDALGTGKFFKHVSAFEIGEAIDLADQKLAEREKSRRKMAKRRKALKKGVR